MPTLHFSRKEFEERQKAACLKIAEAGLDGLILFRQESMYYLTGYDTVRCRRFWRAAPHLRSLVKLG